MPEARGTLPRILWPGLKKIWGQDYKKHPEEWKMIFDEDDSDKNHEEDLEIGGVQLAQVKTEGQSSPYDNMRQGPQTNYIHLTYSQGYIVTEEEFDDNQYEKVGSARTGSLAFAFRTTREVVGAQIFNRSSTSGYNGGDGVTLLSTAHPTLDGSTQANRTTAFADLSEAALEDMLKLISAAKNTLGFPIQLRPKRLITSTDGQFDAIRIVKSVLQSGTANNDTNAINTMNLFMEDPMIYHYLTDSDSWYVTTDVPGATGLKSYTRKPRILRRESDFDTDNLKVKGIERYSFGWSDFRSVYGSAGA